MLRFLRQSLTVVTLLALVGCAAVQAPPAPPDDEPPRQEPLPAAPPLVERALPHQVLALMRSEGWDAHMDDGDIIWTIDGRGTILIFLLDSQVLLFRAAMRRDVALDDVNAWNRSRLFTRSYLDEDGIAVLELDLDLLGGVSAAHIAEFLRMCRTSYLAWYATFDTFR